MDDEVIFTEEVPIIYEALNKNLDMLNLGILLLFKTGIRPGELVALKPEDISNNHLHIGRTEIRYNGDDGKSIYEVRDFPKTEAGIRDVIVRDVDCWILKRLLEINPSGKYLFEQDGERVKSYVFRSRLDAICRKTGVKRKSLNKARKVYSTVLINNKVEESIITAQLGHTNISTTMNYYYKNTKSMAQREDALNKIIGI